MNSDFFIANRARLCAALEGGVVLVSAYDKMQLSHDMAAPFVQESNFWWLTGLELPGWRLFIDTKTGESALIEPRLSSTEKIFESYYSREEAFHISGVSNFISETEVGGKLAGKKVYVLRPPSKKELQCEPNPAVGVTWKFAKKISHEISDVQPILARLRAIKQPQELAAIESAIDVTVAAFERIGLLLPSLSTEAEVAAEFTYDFMRQGAAHAYDPIVAAGKNACTLHYVKNDSALEGLVLLDIGARIGGYSADITRTYAYAEPTARERAVHGAVARAHTEIIQLLRPGLVVKEYLSKVDTIMQRALVSLGLMEDMQDEERYRRYFPHAISHGLGVDVHDSLGRAEVFQEGMVLTVEPGIYLPKERIGVRIEDNILITASGCRNLSERLRIVL